ncbi:MAG TPA: Hsp70 family protein [Vicinamibacteria bacterium]|nr:Hsp70 family protein [Vicinamibacteria bacterium]
MRLGIDFGTTHTVAAMVDRGNYPVVSYEWGDAAPSLVAVRHSDGALRLGQEALPLADDPSWTLLRSIKRLLAHAGPLTEVQAGGRSLPLLDLLVAYLEQLREDIVERSNAGLRPGEPIEVAVSVPANASNDQRFLTLEAFQRAGFEVLALLNEPSAAGFEYAHRFRSTVTSRREYVLVYDLGGGTFDSSLIHMAGRVNEVITTAGVARLGGDDLDEAILGLVLDRAGRPAPDANRRRRLLDECRRQKEGVGPNTRRLVVDLEVLGRAPLVLPMDEVYEACAPLITRTVDAMEEVMRDPRREEEEEVGWDELAGIYVVGGASSFPLVYRQLRERFGQHRVRRSPHPYAATAIGLANFLDEDAAYELSDCLTRHFGVWREAETGREISFDPIFLKDTRLPRAGEASLVAVRRYRPAHNLGHYRFVECGRMRAGRPDGDVTPWDEVRFPFDPGLREASDLGGVPVVRREGPAPEVEERYRCTSAGIFEVTLAVLDDGYSRTFRIARGHLPPPPARKRAARAARRTRSVEGSS